MQALWFKVVLGERAGDQTAIMNMSTYFDYTGKSFVQALLYEVVLVSILRKLVVQNSTGTYYVHVLKYEKVLGSTLCMS